MNRARSLSPALFVGGWALSQLWLFIVFPIVGAVIAGLVCRCFLEVPASARDGIEGPGEATEWALGRRAAAGRPPPRILVAACPSAMLGRDPR